MVSVLKLEARGKVLVPSVEDAKEACVPNVKGAGERVSVLEHVLVASVEAEKQLQS